MSIIAAISVDLDRAPLGTRSRLAESLMGRPILRRTLERVMRVDGLAGVHVLCPAKQADRVRPFLEGLDVRLETHDAPAAPYEALVRASRIWGPDGWRGGVGSFCCFDEDCHVAMLHALLERVGAEAALTIPAAAPVVDPNMLGAMIDHFIANRQVARLTIVQAPPGLGGFIIKRDVLADLLPLGLPPGGLLAHQPGNPLPDITGKDACYRPPAEVVEARGRLLCDTRRSMDRVRRLLEAGGESWDASRICRWLSTADADHVAEVPEEIEIELTTAGDASGNGSLLRPDESETGRRGPVSPEVIDSVAESMGDYDDVRIVLGGIGEPCVHPDFAGICRRLREGGAAAMAVRTNARWESAAVEAALFETPVDLIEVRLDAATPEGYRRAHGEDAYDGVMATLKRWIARKTAERKPLPLLVPSFVKSSETLSEMESFVDTWYRRLGTAVVTGYSHCAGQRPRRAVTETAPPERVVCRRVFSRMMILADGRVTTCDQDFAGRQTFGRLPDNTLNALWRSEMLQGIRTRICGDAPLCPACSEWHRP